MFKKGNTPKPKKQPSVKRDYRKVIKWSIIALIVFWTLGSFRGFSAINRISAIQNEPVKEVEEVTVNFATGPAAENFTEKFLRQYFTWNNADTQERAERLKPYLLVGMDEQAGLRFGNESASAAVYTTELWNIKETGKNSAKLTYKVQYKTKHIEEEIKKEKKKEKVIKKEVQKGPFTKWIDVSIITDGQNFKVNASPNFVSAPEEALIEVKNEMEIKSADPDATDEINAFLLTFFKQYANGTKEELQFLTSDKNLKPIGGELSFEKLDTLTVHDKKKDGSYKVKTTPIFKDSNTNASMAQEFTLSVFEKDGKWQVKTIN